jgi:DHA2 family multidrug resistance protein
MQACQATCRRRLRHRRRQQGRAWQQAIIALGNAVKRQALVLGFSDTFAVIGIVLILAGIAILLTGKPKSQAAGPAH